MCYNCGCGMPNDDHGDSRNITNKTFDEAAEAVGQSAKDARTNTDELLSKVNLETGEKKED